MCTEPRQRMMVTIGAEGCLLLSIVHLAEGVRGTRVDALKAYVDALADGLIRDDCYVLDPARLMSVLTVQEGWVCLNPGLPITPCQPGDLEVLRFERQTPATLYTHFVVGDGQGRVAWDPLGDSMSVAQGHLAGRRIFRRVMA